MSAGDRHGGRAVSNPASPSNEQRYFDALRRIAKGYCTPDQLRRIAEKDYGVSPEEAIEMAYENMQAEAARSIHGRRRPRGETDPMMKAPKYAALGVRGLGMAKSPDAVAGSGRLEER